MNKLFDECKKKNGSIIVDGQEVAIWQNPYLTNNQYEGIGITKGQAKYNFDPAFDSHYRLVWEMLNDHEDESERCDWDNPAATLI